MNKCIKLTALAFAASLAFAATHTQASNGVFEISQACAEGPGCFAGDDPGFPVTIQNSGSYRLTSSLKSNGGGRGIQVLDPNVNSGGSYEPNVTLDLNGFTVFNFQYGIDIASGDATIINGNVEKSTQDGIAIRHKDSAVRIANVSLINTTESGVYVSNGRVTIDNIQATGNKTGVFQAKSSDTDPYVVVKNSTFLSNRDYDIGTHHGKALTICTNNVSIGNGKISSGTSMKCLDPKQTNVCLKDNKDASVNSPAACGIISQ